MTQRVPRYHRPKRQLPRKYDRVHLEAWALWSLATSGNLLLNAICTDNGLANDFRKEIEHSPKIIHSWVKPITLNHCFSYENDDGTITVH